MGLFKNKYRIKSARLPYWDYTTEGFYFVTICTKNKEHFFGTISNGVMQISEVGQIVTKEWLTTELVRENVKLDEWVIMPNHFHGIIVIHEHVETTRRVVSTIQTRNSGDEGTARETTRRVVSTIQTRNSGNVGTSRETTHRVVSTTLKSNYLCSIIGQFKSIATKKIRENGYHDFAWQPRFHDHIVRNEKSLNRIRTYIQFNPEQWEYDGENQNDISSKVKQKVWKDMLG